MIERICTQCGKKYSTYPSVNLYFCSHRCSSDWRRGRTWGEIFKTADKMHKNMKGRRHSPDTEFKKGWQNTERGKEIIKKRVKKLSSGMSKPEQTMVRIIEEQNLPFKFVGDGKLIIGSKCPDFIFIDDGRKIIEVFSDYWHRDDIVKYWHQTEEGCRFYYELFGYNVLVIWQHEFKDVKKVIDKIQGFMSTTLEFDIPKNTKENFDMLCNQEFNGNAGLTLKAILDYFLTDAKYIDLLERIMYLEQSRDKQEKSDEIKTLGGKVVKKKGDKK